MIDARRHGLRVRREVLGDAHVDRAVAGTTTFTAQFQDFITRYAWGDVWARPGLDRRTRSCVTLAALTALRAEGELAPPRARGRPQRPDAATRSREVILHTAVYAGVPAANAAFKIAQRVLAELEAEAEESANGEPRS